MQASASSPSGADRLGDVDPDAPSREGSDRRRTGAEQDAPGPPANADERPRSNALEVLRDRVLRLANTTDGATAPDEIDPLESHDRIAAFRPAILAIRWGTTSVSIALAAPYFGVPDLGLIFWCAAIFGYTVLRTIRPDRYTDDLRSVIAIVAEVAFHTLAVSTTGFWDSPLVFSLATAVIVAGFARGFAFAIRIAVASALLVSIPYLTESEFDTSSVRLSTQWLVSLVLIGLVAGYARRISGEADRQHSLALNRLGRLADANALLFSLHQVTQTLPASLDLDEVLETTVGRLRSLFPFDVVAFFALDEVDGAWEVLHREGVRLGSRLEQMELPPPLHRAVAEQTVIVVDDLEGAEGPGASGRSGSGMYATLPARGAVIGLMAVESRSPSSYSPRDAELFRGFVEPVGLAIDNARWFDRLRTVGADEERTRIARDLHDRIGQSLAYLGFELDRLVDEYHAGADVEASLERLRADIRGVVGEVRDTLYDLRTDVTDEQGIADVLAAFAQRVRERSKLDITVDCDRDRLPILQEREMWRIAQEALTNVERHASASEVRVIWRCDGSSALLDIKDDGAGLPLGQAARMDAYGILGMKERASSIGAQFEISGRHGEGTRVRCRLTRL